MTLMERRYALKTVLYDSLKQYCDSTWRDKMKRFTNVSISKNFDV